MNIKQPFRFCGKSKKFFPLGRGILALFAYSKFSALEGEVRYNVLEPLEFMLLNKLIDAGKLGLFALLGFTVAVKSASKACAHHLCI